MSYNKKEMRLRSDLALEATEMIDEKKTGILKEENKLPEGIEVETLESEFILTTKINITNKASGDMIGKKAGSYITFELKDKELNTLSIHKEVARKLSEEFSRFLNMIPKPSPAVMVIGLGNRYITPDSLGPKVTEKIVVTRHVISNPETNKNLDCRLGNVCAIAPGVMGVTGIETGEIVKGLVEKADPDIIFTIDALAARKTSRVNTTIQISDTGIIPGSGVGNRRMELSKETLGIPVISIGVPTVVDALTLAKDLLEKHEGKEIENDFWDNIAIDYGKDMVVTPKNIDSAIERMAVAISNGLNMSIHKGFDFGDISEYLL